MDDLGSLGMVNIEKHGRNRAFHGSLNVPMGHITQPWMVYGQCHGYYKVMSNIPKMGQLPTPAFSQAPRDFRMHLIIWHAKLDQPGNGIPFFFSGRNWLLALQPGRGGYIGANFWAFSNIAKICKKRQWTPSKKMGLGFRNATKSCLGCQDIDESKYV